VVANDGDVGHEMLFLRDGLVFTDDTLRHDTSSSLVFHSLSLLFPCSSLSLLVSVLFALHL
jgi:hypothetical protein